VSILRIATIEAPFFACGPIEVGRGWTDVEVTERAREVLITYVGRIVQLHPLDLAKLAELGLALEGGRLVEVEPAQATAPTGPDANRKRR